MSDVQIRILSGANLGADIVLPNGRWTVGRDDSCDIILADPSLEARHVSFVVSDAGLLFESLDGVVTAAAGAETSDVLDAGSLYKLGDVLFAWGPKDAPEGFWESVQAALKGFAAPTPAAAEPEPEQEAPSEEPDEAPDTQAPASPQFPKEAEDEKLEDETKPRSAKAVIAAAAAVVLLSAGVAGGWSWMHRDQNDVEERTAAVLKEAARHVKSAGFANVVVKADPSGSLRLTGSVKNDEERGRLVALARLLGTSAVLDVTVDSDYTEPVKSAFNTLDFWPEVTLATSPEKPSQKTVNVAAYMMTNVTEEQAFLAIQKDLPAADDVTVKRRILYKDDVAQVFSKAFYDAGVVGARLEYLPGRVKLVTTLTPDRKVKLDKALEAVKRACPVPLVIDVVNEADQNAAVREKKIASSPSPSADPMKPSFRVSGVSGGALKFVTLSTGEKVFAGGRLPGGFVLETVQYDKLVLTKNGKRVVYPLRINK